MRIISALWEAARKSIKRVSFLIRYSHLSRCRDNRKEECMNLDEMLAASGITGGAKAENTRTKTGFVTFIGRPNVGSQHL